MSKADYQNKCGNGPFSCNLVHANVVMQCI